MKIIFVNRFLKRLRWEKSIVLSAKKKYKEFKEPKISYIYYKILLLYIVRNKCRSEDKQLFMEEESIEILKSRCLITNIEAYQKIYSHVWRKHISRI